MDIEDRLSITTPEGVTVDLVLAGAGSRGVALLVDGIIQGLLYLAVLAVVSSIPALDDADAFGSSAQDELFLAVAIAALFLFGIQFLYDVLFETLGSGRTPGKRMTGLRVVRVGGGPVGFLASAIRNLLRLVDFLPGPYLVGLIAIVASGKNQRLGDMAAGTLVVRERTGIREAPPAWPPLEPAPEAIDVSTVTAEDLATVRRFLERRTALAPEVRQKLAYDLASRLAPKVGGALPFVDTEKFLEQVAAAKAARG